MQQEQPEVVNHAMVNKHDEVDDMKKALAWKQLQFQVVANALEEREIEHEAVKHLVPDTHHGQELVKITLAEHRKSSRGCQEGPVRATG